jgi:transglutaminase-like putative cysteine protease
MESTRPTGESDFTAWMEVYLEGKWHCFDPRHNSPRIGRILVARGRDAADVALTSSFGPAALVGFAVWISQADMTLHASMPTSR